MLIQRNYKPTKKALEFHSSTARFIVLVGGQGCMREDSLVETNEGLKAFGDITSPQWYRSWDGESFVHSPGTAPFPKGKGMLYRVQHERGEFVASGEHLILSADGEYRPLVGLDRESSIFAPRLLTSSVYGQSEFLEDVRHSFQRALSCLDGYLECFRPRDLQPLAFQGNAQSSAPSQVGVLGSLGDALSELCVRLDALPEPEQGRNRRHQQSFRQSTCDFSRQAAALTSAFGDCISTSSSGYTSDVRSGSLRSRMTTELRRIKLLLSSVFHSFRRPIPNPPFYQLRRRKRIGTSIFRLGTQTTTFLVVRFITTLGSRVP